MTATRQQCNNAMDAFAADQVHLMMVAVEWRCVAHDDRTPSPREIRKTARRLCEAMIGQDGSYATGGLRVRYEEYDGQPDCVEIVFEGVTAFGYDDDCDAE